MERDLTARAALFDLDGVLLDTETLYTHFWKEAGRKYKPENPTFAQDIKGNSLTQIFADHFSGDTLRQEEIKAALERFESEMDFRWIAGAERFVQTLRSAGVPTAVVTSSNKQKMACISRKLPGFAALFTHVFTAEDATRSKPAPDCYLHAASELGVPPEECVVFEDSANGLLAARESGAAVVGLSTTLPPEAISPLSDRVIANFEGATIEDLLGTKHPVRRSPH